ncbi:MAG: helix-turn-helix domain-containing protein [Methanosarcinales archaeon]
MVWRNAKFLKRVNRIIEEVCGFANTSGGTIVIGVTNSGEVFDVKVGKDTLEKLTNKITNNTDPIIYPRIESIEIDESKNHGG